MRSPLGDLERRRRARHVSGGFLARSGCKASERGDRETQKISPFEQKRLDKRPPMRLRRVL
jgi:hypothetical protein